MNQYLPYLDSYCRVVWPIVITCWLYMSGGDVIRRMRENTHKKDD